MATHSESTAMASRDAALADRIDGEVATGDADRALYATDASVYRQRPATVAFPRSTADVSAIVEYATETDRTVTARGAGSSLTGNAIGDDIVVDASKHLTEIRSVDEAARTVTVDPGVVLDELNDHLRETYGLSFPPDPSTSGSCTIGGMVANDAAGAHSVRHGTTRDNVVAVEVVLADGSVETFERVEGDDLAALLDRDDRVGEIARTVRRQRVDLADEIDARYPDVDRNSSGYDLAGAGDEDGAWLDLATLVVGSEGTLGFITGVTLALTPVPEARAAAMVYYEDVVAAAAAVPAILRADPSAVELIDETVLEYARSAWDVDRIPADSGAALLVEVESRSVDAVVAQLDAAIEKGRTDATVEVQRAVDQDERADLWSIRKASNPLLNRRPGPEEAPSFIEDAAIPPAELATYLSEVLAVLREYDLETSVFGHAGQGVLHVKPFLDMRDPADRDRFVAVSEAVHEIVLDHGGSVSGEHGDGRLRSRYVRAQYGDRIYEAFRELKRTFDPEGRFNPGIIVPDEDGDLAALDEHFRYEDYAPAVQTASMDFGADGVDGVVERCNGCSSCRTTGEGVMCPTYRATRDEIMSTRGRANLLREGIDGTLGPDAVESDWFQEEVLDLCLACKGCETECPTGVDMAKLKTELKHRRHQSAGIPLRSRLFADVRWLNRLGTAVAPLANWTKERPTVKRLLEAVVGIDARRSLPDFASQSFGDWYESRDADDAETGRRVVFFPDSYMSYNHPAVGRAAIELLEGLGFDVVVPSVTDSGRAALSQGMVDRARTFAARNVDALSPYVAEGLSIVAVEPSSASALVEYDDLLEETAGVPAATTTVTQFLLDELGPAALAEALAVDHPRRVAYHGHCHAKAKGWADAASDLLALAGYDVVSTDATCCGMAGAFGYETEHYELSMRLGDDLERELDAAAPDVIAVSGASCSQQLADRDRRSTHPIELLAAAISR